MKNLPFPSIKTSDYLTDIFNFRDLNKIDRFIDSSGIILLYERMYALRAINNELSFFQKGNPIEEYVSKNELMSLYDNKFVKEKGRNFYLDILNSTPICPSCLLREVEQVDHYLPKSQFPIFSVSVANLVPICGRCNGLKNDSVYDMLLIHPYFDEISSYEWLYVDIIYDLEIGFKYYVKVPSTVDPIYNEKITSHMTNLNLFEVYSSRASNLHSSILPALKNILEAGGKDIVHAALKGYYQGATRDNINNFEAAFYKALMTNDYISRYLSKV